MIDQCYTQDWFSNNIPHWQEHVLKHLASIASPRCLEIGVFEGRSSTFLLANIPTLQLTVIDPWIDRSGATDESYGRFLNNVKAWENNVCIIKGKSQLARSLPVDHFDMVYVDGDHTSAAVIHDAIISYELLKVGGILVFDDYLGGDGTIDFPKPAIDFFHVSYASKGKINLIYDGYQRIYKKII